MNKRTRILKETLKNGKVQYRCQVKTFLWWKTMTVEHLVCDTWFVTNDAVFETFEEATRFLGIENQIVKRETAYDSKN